MRPRFRISTDGFLDLRDTRRVRTPGKFERHIEATPEAHALSFLLSHSFPGHRKVVRRLREQDRRSIRLALWADSVSERMDLVDRVWRNISEPVIPPADLSEPVLVQVLTHGDKAWPLYLTGNVTRVMPPGGLPVAELQKNATAHLNLMSA